MSKPESFEPADVHAMNARQYQAIRALKAIIEGIQADAIEYLKPGGQSKDWFIGRVLSAVDGPEQRAAAQLAQAAQEGK